MPRTLGLCLEWWDYRGRQSLLIGRVRDTGKSSNRTGDTAAVLGSSSVCFPESWEERLLARVKHLQSSNLRVGISVDRSQ